MLRSLCRKLRPRYFMPDEFVHRMGNTMDRLVFVICGLVEESDSIAPMPEDEPISSISEGLIAASTAFGSKLKTSFRSVTITEAYVATEKVYRNTMRVQPKIGGLFRDFKELIADTVAIKHYKNFVDAQHCGENLRFYLAVEDYRK